MTTDNGTVAADDTARDERKSKKLPITTAAPMCKKKKGIRSVLPQSQANFPSSEHPLFPAMWVVFKRWRPLVTVTELVPPGFCGVTKAAFQTAEKSHTRTQGK